MYLIITTTIIIVVIIIIIIIINFATIVNKQMTIFVPIIGREKNHN